MTEKKRLKRGLDHFLSQSSLSAEHTSILHKPTHELSELPITAIQPGKYQARQIMDASTLEELANSIRVHGILQPVVVRRLTANQYELIAGERRWRAATIAGLKQIPAIVKAVDDQHMMVLGLIENIQRENLNPIEEAEALHDLMTKHSLTHQQLAEAIGKSRATISNILRLLGLTPIVKQAVIQGELSLGHAKVLLGLTPELQDKMASQIIEKHLSVRDTERWVKKLQQDSESLSVQDEVSADPMIIALERRLAAGLNMVVKLKHTASGQGKLVIHYQDLKELENILTALP